MRIYFSGIGGVGIGPLAQIANDGGYEVIGSDLAESPLTHQLKKSGVDVRIGQDGSQIARAHDSAAIDWFIYTSALPADHPELVFARDNGIRTSKRDEFLAEFIKDHDLQLIAVAGTHGKTTTTGLFMYALQQLGIPLSYSIGTTVSWGPSGHFDPASSIFVYECDEYDRNFLHFEPHISIITALDYDHVDSYPTEKDYRDAFVQFLQQSNQSIMWEKDLRYLKADPQATLEAYDDLMDLGHLSLAGNHVRHNAFLVQKALEKMIGEQTTSAQIIDAINAFPGTSRRFEKLANNLYSDYGHHPAEIAATLQMAKEMSDTVALVYQPHQNVRQHEICHDYTADVFKDADEVYWLPTYLSREDPSLAVLTPEELSEQITNTTHIAEMNDTLWETITQLQAKNILVLCMGAGSIDSWVRSQLN
ncbi:MAG: Mur ligase domain-containing protein [Candidatus Saccharimonadales bacterium]